MSRHSRPCDPEALAADLKKFSDDLDRALTAAAVVRQAEFAAFFSALGVAVAIAERAQGELDRRTATRFSIFDYISVYETDLSRVFGGLLEPSGKHGQGDRFLRFFLDQVRCGLQETQREQFPNADVGECRVHLESPTATGGRIDIVLELPGNRWIGIENKPWAVEQEKQVESYLADLRGKTPSSGWSAEAWLVYLSGDGSDPETLPGIDEERVRCVTMAYRGSAPDVPSVEEWVRLCLRECEAERVRWFLTDLLEYVRRSFKTSDRPYTPQ